MPEPEAKAAAEEVVLDRGYVATSTCVACRKRMYFCRVICFKKLCMECVDKVEAFIGTLSPPS